MKEIWKDIEGFEGHYQISNYGSVKSLKFGKERIGMKDIDLDKIFEDFDFEEEEEKKEPE